MFLKELVMGLQSDKNKKQELAIETADELIRRGDLNDLELVAEELL
jgi:hypothetical protein